MGNCHYHPNPFIRVDTNPFESSVTYSKSHVHSDLIGGRIVKSCYCICVHLRIYKIASWPVCFVSKVSQAVLNNLILKYASLSLRIYLVFIVHRSSSSSSSSHIISKSFHFGLNFRDYYVLIAF